MRKNWHQYFMDIAKLTAMRSTCMRRQVGAVLVSGRNIIATGYNGAPSGFEHCEKTGCLREEMNIPSGEQHEICRAVHAEQNLIIQAAHSGARISNAVVYCTHFPCPICARILANSSITTIYFTENYPSKALIAQSILIEAGVKLVTMHPPVISIENPPYIAKTEILNGR